MLLQEKPKTSAGRLLGICLVFSLLAAAVPSALIALFLLVDGETWAGRLFAFSWLFMCASVFCFYQRLRKGRGGGIRILAIVVGGTVLGFALCFLLAPSGKSSSQSKLQSVFLGGHGYSKWTPPALVPEWDQIKLGADLIPYADNLMTREKSVRMKTLFRTAYQEMAKDPEFAAVGSVMGCVYADAFGVRCGHKHLFAYVPEHKPGQKLPVILFLHGSVGNFKAYTWTWKRLADARQVAIVAPSFGFGNWDQDGGVEMVDTAYDYIAHHAELDASRVVLAGLSNGGIGVSRAFCRTPERYKGLIYISAVMEEEVMASQEFVKACVGKRILALHGDQDERIPLRYVKGPLASLSAKVEVQTQFYSGEDHFLFLSKRDELLP